MIFKKIFKVERGFNFCMRRNQGRSLRVFMVNITILKIRGVVWLCSTINIEEIVHFNIFAGTCNSDIFAYFLGEFDNILIELYGIRNDCIYMYNAIARTSRFTKNEIKILKNSTKYLSPYSFMLNHIENVFSKIKNLVRQLLGVVEIKHWKKLLPIP